MKMPGISIIGVILIAVGTVCTIIGNMQSVKKIVDNSTEKTAENINKATTTLKEYHDLKTETFKLSIESNGDSLSKKIVKEAGHIKDKIADLKNENNANEIVFKDHVIKSILPKINDLARHYNNLYDHGKSIKTNPLPLSNKSVSLFTEFFNKTNEVNNKLLEEFNSSIAVATPVSKKNEMIKIAYDFKKIIQERNSEISKSHILDVFVMDKKYKVKIEEYRTLAVARIQKLLE